MKLSVIIPCYNAAETIADQLEALSKQRWDYPWEVIVVDNRSSDDSMKIVKQYENKFENFHILAANKKSSAGYARNVGAEKSEAEYLAFVDADDIVGENWLGSIGAALLDHDFVACRMEWVTLNDFSDYTLKYKIQREGLITFGLGYFFPYAGAGTLGVKKNIHTKVGGFDEEMKYLEDTDYCCRIQQKGHELKFLPDTFIHIRARDNNYQRFKQEMRYAEYDVYLSKKFSRHGVKTLSFKRSLRSLYYHLRQYKKFYNPDKKVLWLGTLGIELGRLKGMVKYKLIKHQLIERELGKNILQYNK